jgi:hypothetical protein
MDCPDDRPKISAISLPLTLNSTFPSRLPSRSHSSIAMSWGLRQTVHQESSATVVHVPVGIGQEFIFRENDRPIADYDGHHLQVYVAYFSGPHRELGELSLIREESDQQQYRVERTSSILPAVRPCSLLSTKFAA